MPINPDGEDAPLVPMPEDGSEAEPNKVAYLRALHARDGMLTAESLRQEILTDPTCPFRWEITLDIYKAAEERQLDQCRAIIRRFKVVIQETKVRSFVFLRSEGSYTPVQDAMSRTDFREEMVRQFLRDAQAFRARWASHRVVAEYYEKWIAEQGGSSAAA